MNEPVIKVESDIAKNTVTISVVWPVVISYITVNIKIPNEPNERKDDDPV